MDWNVNLKSENLKVIYDDYLYQQEQILKYYLSSVLLSGYSEFDDGQLQHKISASHDFHESATSSVSVGEIKLLIQSGDYNQLARSFSIFGLITSFVDFFEELRKLLCIPAHEVKKAISVEFCNKIMRINPSCLKIANFVAKQYGVESALTKKDAMLYINCLINLRHMFVHNRGNFSANYTEQMIHKWCNLNAGEKILFNDNDFDSVLWYLNSHLRAFVVNLDKQMSKI